VEEISPKCVAEFEAAENGIEKLTADGFWRALLFIISLLYPDIIKSGNNVLCGRLDYSKNANNCR